MESKFKDLPADAQERISIRNVLSDRIGQAQISADKADFLVDLMNQTYMGELPTKENAWAWVYNREKIYKLVDIIRDYSYAAAEELNKVQDWIDKQNAADGWGGENQSMAEIKCEILETLAEFPEHNGYHLELNLIQWGNNDPKYDLRRWNSDRSRMTKGITFSKEELFILKDELSKIKL